MKTTPLLDNFWFVAPRQIPWLGLLTLLISGAALAYALNGYLVAMDSLGATQANAAEGQKRSRAQKTIGPDIQFDNEARRAQATANRTLSHDWNAVFSAVESGIQPPARLTSWSHSKQDEFMSVTITVPSNVPLPSRLPADIPAHWVVREALSVSTGGGSYLQFQFVAPVLRRN